MARIPWFERKFDFSFPMELYPELIERLRGTPARVEERVRSLAPAILTQRDGERWSIQENVGHLYDLEALFSGRLDDFDRDVATLRAADLTNKKTHEAEHNGKHINDILESFRRARGKIIRKIESRAPEFFSRTALHPRLNKPMRVVDSLYFQAEHDDYHLARITELIRLFPVPD